MELLEMYRENGVSREVYAFGETVLKTMAPRFAQLDAMAELNQGKVIRAMQENRVDAPCFAATTGYGYDDVGRERLERVYAHIFGTEAALVRPQITCGTHALTVALSANLLPGDELLSPVGAPYDTLQEVIGIRPSPCSLAEYGVRYRQVELLADGSFDYPAIRAAIGEKTKLITIQRSKGLGENDPEMMWLTTMNPETRMMMQITPDDAMEADRLFTLLMGDQVEPRKLFIQENSDLVKDLDV